MADVQVSPLRPHGIYRFRDREYTAVDLSTPEQPWRSTGLVCWPAEQSGPSDILYLRHGDGVLLGVADFRPVGTLADLTDTGRDDDTDEGDPMPVLHIHVDGEGAWPELGRTVGQDGPRPIRVEAPMSIACLAAGMASGKPSVTLRLDLPDGTVVLGETSLALLLTAADAFKARHGDPR